METIYLKEEYPELSTEDSINIQIEDMSSLLKENVSFVEENSIICIEADPKVIKVEVDTTYFEKNHCNGISEYDQTLHHYSDSTFSEATQIFECLECFKSFTCRRSWRRHNNFIHKNQEVLQCPECSTTFTRKDSLSKHISAVHRKIKPFSCSQCSTSFTRRSALSHHINTVHSKLRSYNCPECKGAFTRANILRTHIAAVHMHLKPFVCSDCGSSFSQKRSLVDHISAVHNKARPFSCPDCCSYFSQKPNLARHIDLVHKKLKPFQCNECFLYFSRKDKLNNHKKVVHLKYFDKRFCCVHCEAAFDREKLLIRHLQHCLDKRGVSEIISPIQAMEGDVNNASFLDIINNSTLL